MAQGNNIQNQTQEQTPEELEQEFINLLTNKIDKKGYNTDNINKIDSTKDIIYTLITVENKAAYDMDLNIPVFNIQGEVPTAFNSRTQELFINTANQIISNSQTTSQGNTQNNEITINTGTNTRSIYELNYQAYINGNILSVVIRASLKMGTNPQKIMVQTYNYNLATGEEVYLSDLLEPYGLKQDEINSNIEKVVIAANTEAQALINSGYSGYTRNLDDAIYDFENINTFFLGPNGELYIIFAYGNNSDTSEMDIVKMDTYPNIDYMMNANNVNNNTTNTTIENTTQNNAVQNAITNAESNVTTNAQ